MKNTLLAIFFVAAPKVVAGIGQFAVNLLLIRHFNPAEFGVLAVCLTAILLFDSFLGSAIDMAILRSAPTHIANGNTQAALSIQKAALLLKPLSILLLSFPIIVWRHELSTVFFQRREFAPLIVWTMLALAAILTLRSLQTYFQVSHRFGWYGGVDLAHNFLRYGFCACAAVGGFVSPTLVLAAYAIAPLIIVMVLFTGPARPFFRVPITAASVDELSRVLAWFVPVAAVGGLTSRMDVFFAAHLAGIKQAGLFSAAQAIGLPVLLFGTYLSVVFGPRIMTQIKDGTLATFYFKFQLSISACSVLMYGFFLIVQPWMQAFFPPRFSGAWPVLIVLLPSLLAGLISFPLTISLLLFLKPSFLFAIDACAIPLLCAAYILLGPRFGALGIASVTTAYSMLKLGILQVWAWRLLKRLQVARLSSLSSQLDYSETR